MKTGGRSPCVSVSDGLLMFGSMANHVKNHRLSDFNNEFTDETYIRLGINWYNGTNIQMRYSIQ